MREDGYFSSVFLTGSTDVIHLALLELVVKVVDSFIEASGPYLTLKSVNKRGVQMSGPRAGVHIHLNDPQSHPSTSR